MYNLLMTWNTEEWSGKIWELELGRCVREYTDNDITERFGDLDADATRVLCRLPSIFAYEGLRADPKFGFIRAIKRRGRNVRLEYEIVPLEQFPSAEQMKGMLAELDIGDWEINRTHWAVKDVDLAKTLAEHGYELPAWVRQARKAVDVTTHQFDVALSFPGEDRNYVEQVAEQLERIIGPNSYFYDNNYVGQLARPSLDILLQDIYGKRSKLIVVFIGSNYQAKDWCGIEIKAIREIINARDHDRIMFVRTDDGLVDGIVKSDGYVDARKFNAAQVAEMIAERISLIL